MLGNEHSSPHCITLQCSEKIQQATFLQCKCVQMRVLHINVTLEAKNKFGSLEDLSTPMTKMLRKNSPQTYVNSYMEMHETHTFSGVNVP